MVLEKIGNYTLMEVLGEGNFAKVRRAVGANGEQFAVKIINLKKLDDGDRMRLSREIAIMKELDHPNVIKLYEVIENRDTGYIYLVLELASGGELFEYIVAREKVVEDVAGDLFAQIVDAVGYCHLRGVAHRDLKPENLLLDEKNNIKISDFGLGNIGKGADNGGVFYTACGSPSYAAPEILQGQAYGTSVDIWSMGVILFALVTGTLPFQDDNIALLYKKIKSGKYHCPSYISKECKSLIQGMLTLDIHTRFTIKDIQHHPWLKGKCHPELMEAAASPSHPAPKPSSPSSSSSTTAASPSSPNDHSSSLPKNTITTQSGMIHVTTDLPSSRIVSELERVLNSNDVPFTLSSPTCFTCSAGESGGLKFMIEIKQMGNGKHQIKPKRIQGETWTYKVVLDKLMSDLKLE